MIRILAIGNSLSEDFKTCGSFLFCLLCRWKIMCKDDFHMEDVYGRFAVSAAWYRRLLKADFCKTVICRREPEK